MAKNKYIETPEIMWELFTDYAKKTKSKPILKMVFVGKDGIKAFEERERPLTLDGFELYCSDNDIISDLSQYFANTEGRYSDYQTICTRIRKAIREDQISGGMAGIYNPSITQRLNGLADQQKTEVTVNSVNANFGNTIQSPPKPEDNTRLD